MPTEKATFGGGCFWGMEKWFKKTFPKGIEKISVGYLGGHALNPSYKQVCTGTTGHAEVVQIQFDNSLVNYRDLVVFFFKVHNPTTLNRQGNDVGTQYRSAIFFHSPEQEKIANEVKASITKEAGWPWKDPIVTEVTEATTYYPAEDYHQAYLDANPTGYCNHRLYWS